MRMVMMGPPGAGKGTQVKEISSRFDIPAISTGSIFRAHVANNTELGRKIKQIMEAGGYVPDEITDEIVAVRLSEEDAKSGWLLDGYPRTLEQVQALDRMLAKQGVKLDAVLSLTVDPEELVQRMLHRAEIEGRADDNEETIRHRFEIYAEKTDPLLAIYRERGLLIEVDGSGSIADVAERINAVLASIVTS